MIEDVRLAVDGKVPVVHYGRMGGMLFSPNEVVENLKKLLIKNS
jgi:2-oxoglutarate oxidoreductase, alpha subunit